MHGRRDMQRPRDAHLQARLFDLDLTQPGLVQQLGQLPDELLLGAAFLVLLFTGHALEAPLCPDRRFGATAAILFNASLVQYDQALELTSARCARIPAIASSASSYPFAPSPQITPVAASET